MSDFLDLTPPGPPVLDLSVPIQPHGRIEAQRFTYRCSDCDIDEDPLLAQSSPGICRICGSSLTAALVEQQPIGNEHNDAASTDATDTRLQSLFDMLGMDFRSAIDEFVGQSAPSRQISVSYLKTLGSIVVDARKVILKDIYLNVGPLKILAISADFGYLPNDTIDIEGDLIVSDPYTGELPLRNQEEVANCTNAVVLMGRGVVSFAAKSMKAIQAGAKVVIITQTLDIWPFLMTDSAREFPEQYTNPTSSGSNDLKGDCSLAEIGVPIVMIGKKDAELLHQLIEQNKKLPNIDRNKSSSSDSSSGGSKCEQLVHCSLRIAYSVLDCSICQEAFTEGAVVLKLPCRHLYHTDCVTSWLQQNNTCPLCRLELPKEKSTAPNEQSRQPPVNNVTSSYYN